MTSEQIEFLKDLQNRVLDNLDNALIASNWNFDDATVGECRAAYDSTVEAFLRYYGEDAECGLIDPAMSQSYSDIYKDRYGFRPGSVSYKNAKEFLLTESKKDGF